MEQGTGILNIAINLAITAVIYILPPVIYAFLIRKGRLPQKSARTVCIISGLVIWFLLFFVYAALGLESGKRTIGPALIWSGVAYLIIRERNAPKGTVEIQAEETAGADTQEEAELGAAAVSEQESHEHAALSKTPSVKKETTDLLVWAKRNIAAVAVIAVLAGALTFTSVKLLAGNNDKAEIERLNNLVKTNEEIIDGLHENEDRLKGYQDAVLNFYLNGTVIVLEGDDKHYHRYNCPVTKMPSGDFRYYAFNSTQAEAEGYSKCPACFGESSEEYCKNHIENH